MDGCGSRPGDVTFDAIRDRPMSSSRLPRGDDGDGDDMKVVSLPFLCDIIYTKPNHSPRPNYLYKNDLAWSTTRPSYHYY